MGGSLYDAMKTVNRNLPPELRKRGSRKRPAPISEEEKSVAESKSKLGCSIYKKLSWKHRNESQN